MIRVLLLVCLVSLSVGDVPKPLLRPLPIGPVIPPVAAADPFYPYRGEPAAYGGKFSILSYENDVRPDGSYRYSLVKISPPFHITNLFVALQLTE
ncbi:unnamed protein product [Acanthoscelides obtectus]|uniref:Uncharacterized protein n=1 Tax=Acanthoscelides obtectus TaxID=200917 RepID=A0A9P0PBG7_ACAOB|nr:unnamed protein product [Acanthoscelides obtectus]CAK1662915.1 hypothetical protein AOBTE_LOCUS23380 [Acanthoscelides obtectus]